MKLSSYDRSEYAEAGIRVSQARLIKYFPDLKIERRPFRKVFDPAEARDEKGRWTGDGPRPATKPQRTVAKFLHGLQRLHGPPWMLGESMMQKSTAQQLIDLLMRHTADLNETLKPIKEKETEDEFHRVRLMIGKVMGSMYSDALYPIMQEYPDLKPDALK